MSEVANSHGADSKRLRGAGGSPRVHIELRAAATACRGAGVASTERALAEGPLPGGEVVEQEFADDAFAQLLIRRRPSSSARSDGVRALLIGLPRQARPAPARPCRPGDAGAAGGTASTAPPIVAKAVSR